MNLSNGIVQHNNMRDTTLSLNCLGNSQNHLHSDVSNCTDDGCRLVLGLGPTSSSYYVSGFTQQLGSHDNSLLQLGLPAISIDTYTGPHSSVSTYTEINEGSTSSKRFSGIHSYRSPVSIQQRTNNSKKCQIMGCVKGARGASKLCISHGGGNRCQKPGCNKGAESKTTFCKTHGGGKRCEHLGCTKSAEGKTDFCISHGGGRRCEFIEGCNKAARGKSGLCIKHGGGKRCNFEKCKRSAEGQGGLCISHGGGKRCLFSLGCDKGAQGSTNYCKAHGGGKRCIFSGCSKGAEGSTPLCKAHGGGKRCLADGGGICSKSVHGGTDFCVAHGGGKRCVVVGCSKSARGRTDSCVKHGGGKRCKVIECEKSAQGSTDFCKAHGGGKRCCWGGDEKCEKFARGKSGFCAKHNSLMFDGSKSGLIGPGLFSGLVGVCSSDHSQLVSNESRHMMIPMQVLVPSSMKSMSDEGGETNVFDFMVPEERVHGGSLVMSLLGGGSRK